MVKRPSKEKFLEVYRECDKNRKKISKAFDIHPSTVSRWIKRFEIEDERTGEGRKLDEEWRKNVSKGLRKNWPSKEELEDLYWNKELSLPEIAEKFDVSSSTPIYWMKKYGIPRRSMSEALKGKPKPKDYVPPTKKRRIEISKKKLQKLYWEEGKSIKEMSRILGIDVSTIHKRMKEYGIKRRGRIEAIVKKPNAIERRIIGIIRKNDLPFKYVGDGQLVIEGKCPDFVSTNRSKKIIEVFGDYWHNIVMNREYSSKEGRKEFFSKYGYDTLVLWGSELEKQSDEEIANKIVKFEPRT